ncbi:outer membrane lipid asymmetry maintenance protein MlaD [Amaricoccus sp.]|uniref:outer membrane lipid asymmetry maintenance protein MlaD n=1 Tax=Amaricoccus sp. TaxID=1872485 RepID=UPI00262DD66D|nr:outer membrane lipid asymmetry maintenance protein MlaD [Amaricoccus sp.]HRO11697.1 outer membrane lipid asymmetry maintenance protein MlaD [Amaricoccus sp.]
MANSAAEAVIGAVVLATAAGFVFYAGQSRGLQMGGDTTVLHANFRSAEGITVGTDVRLAGINVGSVTGLELDPATFEARTTFTVDGKLRLPTDSDVKIASEGLLGGSFVEITPGAAEEVLESGDEVVNTQGSVSLLNLLMRFGTGK